MPNTAGVTTAAAQSTSIGAGTLPAGQASSLQGDVCVKHAWGLYERCSTQSLSPEWDSASNSLAALSAAIGWGALFLAVVAVAVGLGWGFLVKIWAEKAAKAEAEKILSEWLKTTAPQILISQMPSANPSGLPVGPTSLVPHGTGAQASVATANSPPTHP